MPSIPVKIPVDLYQIGKWSFQAQYENCDGYGSLDGSRYACDKIEECIDQTLEAEGCGDFEHAWNSDKWKIDDLSSDGISITKAVESNLSRAQDYLLSLRDFTFEDMKDCIKSLQSAQTDRVKYESLTNALILLLLKKTGVDNSW